MKKKSILTLIIILSFLKVYGQEELRGNFRIYLKKDGKSINSKVPLILEEEKEKEEILYTYDGKNAVKKSKEFKIVDTSFSFQKINPNFKYSSIIVDVELKENKLLIKPKDDIAKDFNKFNSDKVRKLYIDVSEGIIITKTSLKVSAITVPLKVYLSNQSDSLATFTNNIETDVNIALTIGKSWDKYLFKEGEEAKLSNTNNLFGFIGLNKLELNKKNTDGKNDEDNILTLSSGIGYQYGYGKLGLSFLLGLDLPFSKTGQNWVFKYQPWIGVGIGYSIFK